MLELIQNADDNTFQSSVQTLNIEYRDGFLFFSCNEVGFSRRNVEAICSIGLSTKSGSVDASKFTGEKGIGFKSVFKVADIVWIQSGNYSFKFDRNERLGMVAPIWAMFPHHHTPGFTSIVLKLSPNCNVGDLIKDIKQIDCRLLLFLRRLKRFNLKVREHDGQVWTSTLSRTNQRKAIPGLPEVVLLHQNDLSQSYYVVRHQIDNLPAEPKRQGISKLDMALAFPMQVETSELVTQNIYSFLPIRDFGFKVRGMAISCPS